MENTRMSGDLICLSHLRWGFVFQRPNHLMTRFARDRRVFFFEEPVFNASAPRVEIETVDGLRVVTPHLPSGVPGDVAERMQRTLLESLVARMHVMTPILWFYTPMAVPLTRNVQASVCVYDCMDELSHFHGAPAQLRERERELFALADLVFTGGHSLYEAKRREHAAVHAFPSSVDYQHFEQARAALEDPIDQRAIPHPRLGFFGVVDERMDLDLIRSVATKRPDLHFVVVGPVVKIAPERLPRLPNIHWLGQKTYAELPSYIAGWDVAVMPFARNGATKFISPTKTLEYLAAGKPVVSTSIRDVVRPYGEEGLVRIADDPAAFIEAVDATLKLSGTAARTAHRGMCDAMLAQTSWDRTWTKMNALVQTELSRRHAGESISTDTTASTASTAGVKGKKPCSTI
jgi:glycosyltransferase involved in cell wall biosynthesis